MLFGTSGALMLAALRGSARTATASAGQPGPAAGAGRASRFDPGTTLVHADLHNHTVMSDGQGRAELAFASMREAGLDVAALTDHATVLSHNGLSPANWRTQRALADAADDPGSFTAIRGFEWTHPQHGHVNVWNTADFADRLRAAGPRSLYRWLGARPDGLAGFNHPGREPGRFDDFAFDAAVRDRFVSLEMFNRTEDYLFEGWSSGRTSPLVACLDAGWRPGLTGASDEHGDAWGFHEGKGRSGLWVTENTRAAVFEAMAARRCFATRVSGLRVDATANGVRMGGTLGLDAGDVRFLVDVDRGPAWDGKPLRVQVLRSGTAAPTVVDVVETTSGAVADVTVRLDAADGNWVVVRVADPAAPSDAPGPDGHACNDFGVAYTSPWWLRP